MFEHTLSNQTINYKKNVSQGYLASLCLSGNGLFWDYKWMCLLSGKLNWRKRLSDEGFHTKILFLAEKTIYQVQTNALNKVR